MTDELDADVRRLLFERVTSYEQLEALLLLHASPAQDWTARDVAAALRIDVGNATAALTALAAQRLLEPSSGQPPQRHRYAPADSALATCTDKLARAYAESRLEVVKQMSINAIERVRSSAARTFADAFLLGHKKPKETGGNDR